MGGEAGLTEMVRPPPHRTDQSCCRCCCAPAHVPLGLSVGDYRSEYPLLCDAFGWCRPPGEGNPRGCRAIRDGRGRCPPAGSSARPGCARAQPLFAGLIGACVQPGVQRLDEHPDGVAAAREAPAAGEQPARVVRVEGDDQQCAEVFGVSVTNRRRMSRAWSRGRRRSSRAVQRRRSETGPLVADRRPSGKPSCRTCGAATTNHGPK